MNVAVSHRMRKWCVLVACFGALNAAGILADPTPYRSPIFGYVRAIAPLGVWAALWALAAVVAVVAAVALSWRSWVAMLAVTSFLAAVWTVSVMMKHYIDDVPLTLTAIGLWSWVLSSCVFVAGSPSQYRAA